MNKIIAAIAKIMSEVGSVKKDGENKFHGYKYATASDILHKIQPLLAREGLVIFQNEVSRDLIADGSALAINYEFTIAHKDGDVWNERIKQTGMAAARNSKGGFDDKAANKCHTAARKYFMLALFQIPTGDYDDADEQEDRLADKRNGNGGHISHEQAESLLTMVNEVGADPEKFCTYLKVGSLLDLPAARYAEAVKALEAKRVKQ